VLGLREVEVIHGRAEELGHDPAHREQYDWALARAVAEMPALAEYLLPLVRVGGAALAQKGEGAAAEVHRADVAIVTLGGRVRQLAPVELRGLAEATWWWWTRWPPRRQSTPAGRACRRSGSLVSSRYRTQSPRPRERPGRENRVKPTTGRTRTTPAHSSVGRSWCMGATLPL
jgi:hypothetical protein